MDNKVWIVGIICVTVLFLALITGITVVEYKKAAMGIVNNSQIVIKP